MKKNSGKFLLIQLLLLTVVLTADFPLYTLSGVLNQGNYKFQFKAGDNVEITLKWVQVDVSMQLQLSLPSTTTVLQQTTDSTYPKKMQANIASTDQYLIKVVKPFDFSALDWTPFYVIIDFQIAVLVNGVNKFSRRASISQQGSGVNSFEITSPCRFIIKFNGAQNTGLFLYDTTSGRNLYQPYQVIFPTAEGYDVNATLVGTWYIVTYNMDYYTSYTIFITTQCTKMCLAPSNIVYQRICKPYCGDGILGQGQICDNGNLPGCSYSCVPDNGYNCYNKVGTFSYCLKEPSCGDGIVDLGQQCDNKNQLGCLSGCKIDKQYKCKSERGKPSLCQSCGNNIVQFGQQCDNSHQIGCSTNCKVDPGFTCQGFSQSVCRRKTPVCGNGIKQLYEMCDDGNKQSFDGCSKLCRLQDGFRCTDKQFQLSVCQYDRFSPKCGNNIYQPVPVAYGLSRGFIQQCDNGNKQGCKGCIVEYNWQCKSTNGKPSECKPKIVLPFCGNAIFQPEMRQQCDDGNIEYGDGCNYFCKIQIGWQCKNGKGCKKVGSQNQDKDKNKGQGFCGNGIIEPPQQCDDGFPLTQKKGCTFQCKRKKK